MAYFKINDVDFSTYTSGLKVERTANYTAQTNAAGNSVVDYINSKRKVEVSIIPLNEINMIKLKQLIDAFNVNITYLNPTTNTMETFNAIIPKDDVEYYTIQANKTLFKAVKLDFIEL